jgi:hypothetical protein
VKTSEVLRKAADEIRRRGWNQGDYGSSVDEYSTCAVCAMGAVRAALSPIGDAWGGRRTRERLLAERCAIALVEDAAGSLLPGWNDAEGRTVDEVLDAFSRAAAKAEANGD